MTVRTRKQTVFRIIALTILFLIFWFVPQNVLITSTLRVKHKDKQSLDFELDLSSLGANSKQTRRNIIIVSHGRSGSTITGDMFNHHPSVFYLHEPLQTVERISQFQKERKTSPDDPDYGSLMSEVLNGIFGVILAGQWLKIWNISIVIRAILVLATQLRRHLCAHMKLTIQDGTQASVLH